MVNIELDLIPDTSVDMRPTTRVSPRLVAANYILELSSIDLQRQIDNELLENPALERVDVPTCQVCGSELQGSICPVCIQRQKGTAGSGEEPEWFDRDVSLRESVASDDEFDPLTRVASEETLGEKLLAELRPQVPPDDSAIAEFLVGSLDDKGYLTVSIRELADELRVDEVRVVEALGILQTLEPVGIGSRNLRECLLIQVAYLKDRGITQPYAEEIVSDFLYELGEHKFSRIAQALKISTEDVAAVSDFVKQKLNPHPAHGFSSTNSRDRDTRAMYVLPDVIISRTDDGYEVEVVESRRFALRLSPVYHHLSSTLRDTASLSDQDREHVRQYVNRAKLFMANINQRRQTLFKITCCLVEQQRDFLDQGIRHLRPLSRAAVAGALNLHESTVSRATASKHVMLPDGEVIPFSHFFTPSLSVKDVMKEIIEQEARSLTDAEIAERLSKRGIHIARRTVAKYRMQLEILPSRLRH